MAHSAQKLSIFPTSWKVAGRDIIIVGGGEEALAKARLAVKTQGRVKIVAQVFAADFSGLDVELLRGPFVSVLLANAALVFVADEGADGQTAIAAARAQHVALNVVDQPELCDFYTPAIIDRAPVSIAISTEGAAPVLARIVRAKIETMLSLNLGSLALLAESLRDRAVDVLPNGLRRRRFFEALIMSPRVGAALEIGEPEARREAIRLLDAHGGEAALEGVVWLIGAGPGEEDLLTLRALRLLQEADVIVHGDDVAEQVIQMGRRDAARVVVALDKAGTVLADLVAQGKKVAYLQAGDVGQETVSALAALNISFQIVPGIGSAQLVSHTQVQVA